MISLCNYILSDFFQICSFFTFFSQYLLVTPTFIIEPFFFAISVGTPTFIIEPEKSNPVGLPRSLEVTAGFEPADNGVADRGLTTWLRHHKPFGYGADYGARTRHLDLGKVALYQMS